MGTLFAFNEGERRIAVPISEAIDYKMILTYRSSRSCNDNRANKINRSSLYIVHVPERCQLKTLVTTMLIQQIAGQGLPKVNVDSTTQVILTVKRVVLFELVSEHPKMFLWQGSITNQKVTLH